MSTEQTNDYTLRDGPDGHAIVKLRPCPACGGKAALWADCDMASFHAGDAAIARSSAWIVRCELPAKGGCGLSTRRDKSDRVVIEAWNRRPSAAAAAPPAHEGLEAARVEQMRTLRDWAHDCADTSAATAKAKSNGDDYDHDIAPSFAARGRAFRECADRINGLLALPVPGQSRPAQPPEGIADLCRIMRDAPRLTAIEYPNVDLADLARAVLAAGFRRPAPEALDAGDRAHPTEGPAGLDDATAVQSDSHDENVCRGCGTPWGFRHAEICPNAVAHRDGTPA